MTVFEEPKSISKPVLIRGPKIWQRKDCGDWKALWVGCQESVDRLLKIVVASRELPITNDLLVGLNQVNTPFALILEGPLGVVAVVDQNRSFPVFYTMNGESLVLGGHARAVAVHGGRQEVHPEAAVEATLSGYVTGKDTLLKGVYQLTAGSYLTWRRGEREPRLHQYFRYLPTSPIASDEVGLIEALGKATDEAIGRLIEYAAGRPIWVPLSGGLDSRLIAAKLREANYPRVQTFSFGLPGNTEAQTAKTVAERLELSWFFIPCQRRDMRALFESDERKAYWRFADGLSSVPNPQDFDVMLRLIRDGRIEKDAVLVNGQTGDFISGGHLRFTSLSHTQSFEETADYLMAKHLDLWRTPRTPSVRMMLHERIAKSVGFEDSMTEPRPAKEMAALCELWEHQERQAKYVINQQRAYEFLGVDWMLPFWDMKLVNFWRGVPYQYKLGQNLYKAYLKTWDYRGVFSQLPDNVTAWGKGANWFVLPLSSLAHKLTPVRYHRAIQKPFAYMGRFGHHYSVFPMRKVLSMAGDIRSPISLYTRQWFHELGIPFPDNPKTSAVRLMDLLGSSDAEGAVEDIGLSLRASD